MYGEMSILPDPSSISFHREKFILHFLPHASCSSGRGSVLATAAGGAGSGHGGRITVRQLGRATCSLAPFRPVSGLLHPSLSLTRARWVWPPLTAKLRARCVIALDRRPSIRRAHCRHHASLHQSPSPSSPTTTSRRPPWPPWRIRFHHRRPTSDGSFASKSSPAGSPRSREARARPIRPSHQPRRGSATAPPLALTPAAADSRAKCITTVPCFNRVHRQALPASIARGGGSSLPLHKSCTLAGRGTAWRYGTGGRARGRGRGARGAAIPMAHVAWRSDTVGVRGRGH
ncbi:hypothetical protein BS78_01G419800 [Paspalum vaginatum]|nr:hypothetical protein BS78_01G419800 [Paspalum vaginatum]